MEMRSRYLLITALTLSALVHGLAVGYLARWWSDLGDHPGDTAVSALSIDLAASPGESSPTSQGNASKPIPSEFESDPFSQQLPPLPELGVMTGYETAPPDALDAPALSELNPAPVLREQFQEEFRLGPMLTLSSSELQWSMTDLQQAVIETHLSRWQENLPKWISSGEVLQWEEQGQRFEARVQPAEPSLTGLAGASVKVVTERDGLQLSTELQFQRLAFSQFAQLIDRWDPDISLYLDRIEGRLHSNTPMHVQVDRRGQPEVTGKTTVAGAIKWSNRSRRQEVFTGGLETRVRRIRLPDSFDAYQGENWVEGVNLHHFPISTALQFLDDGRYRWRYPDGSGGEGLLPDHPFLLRGGEKVVLEVSGTVKGSVVVYSPERLIITGHLRYARNPRTQLDSPDFLGLVSDRYVDVASSSVTGGGDLELEAAIYARRRFQVRGWGRSERAQLSLYGSLTAGAMSATEPRFATSMQFDPRLDQQRPAHFPLTDRFELASWEPLWQVEPLDDGVR